MEESGLKTGGQCYFLSSRGQNVTNITKVEENTFYFYFWFYFYGVSHTKTDLYNICVWLIFLTKSSIKLNHSRSSCKKMT